MEPTPELPKERSRTRPPPGRELPVPGRRPGAPRPPPATARRAVRRRHPPHLRRLGVGAVDVPSTSPRSRLAASAGRGGLAVGADAHRLGSARVAPRRSDPSPARAGAARGHPGRGHRVGSGRTARPPVWHRRRRPSGSLRRRSHRDPGHAPPRRPGAAARAAAPRSRRRAGVGNRRGGLDRALRLRRVPRPTAGPARGHVCRGVAGACEAHHARPGVRAGASPCSCGSRSSTCSSCRLPSSPGLSCTVRWFQPEPCLEGPIPGG